MHDYRRAIEYVVDGYFQKAAFNTANKTQSSTVELAQVSYLDNSLPEYPQTFIRDEENRVEKIIYGNLEEVENGEGMVIIWQEEFIRNEENRVVRIETTYPDGLVVPIDLVRDENKVVSIV